jgi:hypothetical protein
MLFDDVTNELELKVWFIENFFDANVHGEEIDISDSPGIPDFNYAWYGSEGWIEFKFLKKGRAKIRPKQTRWFRNRVAAGGRCFIVWGEEKLGYGIIQGDCVGLLNGKLTREDCLRYSAIVGHMVPESQYMLMKELLTHKY